jgi:hypothetical protein
MSTSTPQAAPSDAIVFFGATGDIGSFPLSAFTAPAEART